MNIVDLMKRMRNDMSTDPNDGCELLVDHEKRLAATENQLAELMFLVRHKGRPLTQSEYAQGIGQLLMTLQAVRRAVLIYATDCPDSRKQQIAKDAHDKLTDLTHPISDLARLKVGE